MSGCAFTVWSGSVLSGTQAGCVLGEEGMTSLNREEQSYGVGNECWEKTASVLLCEVNNYLTGYFTACSFIHQGNNILFLYNTLNAGCFCYVLRDSTKGMEITHHCACMI